MVDFSNREILTEFLNKLGFSKTIYNAMRSSDPADTVLATLGVVKQHFKMINHFLNVSKDVKSEETSENYRRKANDAYINNKFQLALEYYNQALLFAPANSHCMKLAYSSRSALLIRVEAYQACLYDIDTCFTMGCPPNIVDKLKSRREEAYNNVWKEKLAKEMITTDFNRDFFGLKVKRNPQIPVASADVGVIIESGIPKIVTVRNIPIGTVLAVETAFVSNTALEPNRMFSCYQCQKICLNLIPCDSCVRALFCSDDCKKKCLIEYHNIECQILGFISMSSMTDSDPLILKALLKIKSLTTWSEFIAASKIWGIERIKNSSVSEMFSSLFAVLCFNENDKHFIYGKKYNASFICALCVQLLEKTNFFPQSSNEKEEAIRAFSRLLLLCFIHCNVLLINQMVKIISVNNTVIVHHTPNFGCFSFMGKLKHACDANSLLVGLNNKLALVSLKPIKSGTEITTSPIYSWLDIDNKNTEYRNTMYRMFNIACNCPRCSGSWKALASTFKLNEEQRAVFQSLNLLHLDINLSPSNVHQIYSVICKALASFSKTPYCFESVNLYRLFRKCILILEDSATENVMLESSQLR